MLKKAIYKAGLTTWFKRLGSNLHVAFDKSSINLSGGELKRVDFARSLLEKAAIILLMNPQQDWISFMQEALWGRYVQWKIELLLSLHMISTKKIYIALITCTYLKMEKLLRMIVLKILSKARPFYLFDKEKMRNETISIYNSNTDG